MKTVSQGQYFVTTHDIKLAGISDVMVHVENLRHLDMTKDPSQKDGFEETKIRPVLEVVKVSSHEERYGIEIKIDSMQQDRPLGLWSTEERIFVTELPVENEKLHHNEEVTFSTVRPVAT